MNLNTATAGEDLPRILVQEDSANFKEASEDGKFFYNYRKGKNFFFKLNINFFFLPNFIKSIVF